MALQQTRAFAGRTSLKSAATPVRVSKFSRARTVVVEARQFRKALGVLGTKAGMMTYFTENGLCVPATVIALEEGNVVTQVKTEDTDGYNAVQIGYKAVAEKKVTKPELGHLKKSGVQPMRHLVEFKLKDRATVESYQPGQALDVASLLKEGETVDIAGVTVGKGFQGTIKRWHHKRGAMTHGSKSHREHGSIGSATTPSRVFPGLKMAGQMGNIRATVKNQTLLKVDSERRALIVKGSVPGKVGNVVEITPAKLVGVNW
ncbi:Plastid ribosomal protein L3, imported to chloroplast, large ribosomal subunit [Pleodorina starrii]|uniref:Large ribosomal subunit protein uL3c n=1 Tax=Pleodorina starrii TaxID=330485 RepID=A0A9W6BV82_9CHLO|nr:Plastid ribosomal protein L3 [Pleodorina starrii]GLC59044.1 Plastid ribosomal protein L3, imported to chloroplast, large ribosomal subunit [Pleodorina starrii]GLC77113.1 Plastid ribosomal protein L3 [Pleodorina starrii]